MMVLKYLINNNLIQCSTQVEKQSTEIVKFFNHWPIIKWYVNKFNRPKCVKNIDTYNKQIDNMQKSLNNIEEQMISTEFIDQKNLPFITAYCDNVMKTEKEIQLLYNEFSIIYSAFSSIRQEQVSEVEEFGKFSLNCESLFAKFNSIKPYVEQIKLAMHTSKQFLDLEKKCLEYKENLSQTQKEESKQDNSKVFLQLHNEIKEQQTAIQNILDNLSTKYQDINGLFLNLYKKNQEMLENLPFNGEFLTLEQQHKQHKQEIHKLFTCYNEFIGKGIIENESVKNYLKNEIKKIKNEIKKIQDSLAVKIQSLNNSTKDGLQAQYFKKNICFAVLNEKISTLEKDIENTRQQIFQPLLTFELLDLKRRNGGHNTLSTCFFLFMSFFIGAIIVNAIDCNYSKCYRLFTSRCKN